MQSVFSIVLSPSKIANGSGLHKTISNKYIDAYSHTIAAFGGYDTAQIGIKIRRSELDNFLLNILGSSIRVATGETQTIWQGFVNEVTTTYDGVDITVGPLMDIANKVLVRYTDFITGGPGTTTFAFNTLSQLRYGTLTKILAASTVSSTNADNIRNNFLTENRFPFYNVGLTIQPPETNLIVTLNCLGNYHLLSTYVYNNALTTTYTAREKIIAVLAAHPLGLLNRQGGLISANTLSVPVFENEDRLAIDVIKELVALGSDTNNNRMLFGVYDDFTVIYKEIPSIVRYHFRSKNNNRFIQNSGGGLVNIASLKPGQYIGVNDIPDLLISGVKSIPKFIFAETITYTAPFGLTITGANVSTLAQRIAKLGLSGMTA